MYTLDGLQYIDERGFKEAVPVRELLARKTVQLFISEFFQGNYTVFDCPTLNDGTPLPGGKRVMFGHCTYVFVCFDYDLGTVVLFS